MTAIHPTTERVFDLVQIFYDNNPQIQASHGLKSHVLVVHYHAVQAVRACHPPLSAETAMEIEVAALLHDVDDEKYFPKKNTSSSSTARYPNAESILRQAGLSPTSTTHGKSILFMIQLVSCSQNGNRVPPSIIESGDYHYLIPRWADRIEAVGTKGVLRCYQYNREHGHALWSRHSPRPQSETEMWQYATPERFQAYQDRSGTSEDMISHYYDKLLHVACPPKEIVQNAYLEQVMRDSSQALIHVCLEFGATGRVNEATFAELEKELQDNREAS